MKGDYLAKMPYDKVSTEDEAFKEAETKIKERKDKLLSIKGSKTVDDFHKALSLIMRDYCGMSKRNKLNEYCQNEPRIFKCQDNL